NALEKQQLHIAMFSSARISKQYPTLSFANCKCMVDELTKRYTKEEMKAMDNLSKKEIYQKNKDLVLMCSEKSGISKVTRIPDSLK
ncbi:MAG: hypothetical protein ACRCYO_10700, partial [Bacteroidia bacterium]